ncbi:MAG: dihydrolipoamide acetyltransferase family protein [Bacteroidota bacterium]
MAAAIIMPRQGQSVESCILTQWYKSVGEKVSAGDILFAYETDKAAFEEEAKADGVLLARFYENGDEVQVLTNMGVIGKSGESVDEFRPRGTVEEEKVVVKSETPDVRTDVPATAGQPVQPNGRNPISPRARRLACEKRVMFHTLKGSGPGGRIIERDILDEIRKGKRLTPLAQKKMEGTGLTIPQEGHTPYGKISSKELVEAPPSDAYTDEPISNVRKIIATAMHRSLQNSAQLTHHMSANASGMLQLRKEVKSRMKEGYAFNITLNDMVCYAVIRALKMHPGANAHFLDGTIRKFRKVNLGLAVDTDRGLLVPCVPDADDLSLTGLSGRLSELVKASRGGSVPPDLLAPGAATFTISNLGNYGVEMFTPVINLPQVGILGVNTILQRPTVLADGSLGFQPFMGLSLTYDHRALDGGPATLFLAEIKNQIESLSENLL